MGRWYRVFHVTRNPPTSMRRLCSALWLTHFPVVRWLLLRHAVATGSTLGGTLCINILMPGRHPHVPPPGTVSLCFDAVRFLSFLFSTDTHNHHWDHSLYRGFRCHGDASGVCFHEYRVLSCQKFSSEFAHLRNCCSMHNMDRVRPQFTKGTLSNRITPKVVLLGSLHTTE
jgi:hypothetical protein